MDGKRSDLAAIQAQFDAKYRQHLSALDDAFASNVQWIESTVDDGLSQLGAEPRCRNKRKHPEVPKFPDNKENTVNAKKSELTASRRQTRTRASALTDTQLNDRNSPVLKTVVQDVDPFCVSFSDFGMQEMSSAPPEGVDSEAVESLERSNEGRKANTDEDMSLINDDPVENVVESMAEQAPAPASQPPAPFVPTAVSGVNDGVLPDDLNKLKVVELRSELKARGVETKGLKKVLVKRLNDLVEEDMIAQAVAHSLQLDPPPAAEEELPLKKRTSEEMELNEEDDDAEFSHRRKRSSVAQAADTTIREESPGEAPEEKSDSEQDEGGSEEPPSGAAELKPTLFPGGGVPLSVQQELASLDCDAVFDQSETPALKSEQENTAAEASDAVDSVTAEQLKVEQNPSIDDEELDVVEIPANSPVVAGATFIPAPAPAAPAADSPAESEPVANTQVEPAPEESEDDDAAQSPTEPDEPREDSAAVQPQEARLFPGGGVPASIAAELDALQVLADHHLAAQEEEEDAAAAQQASHLNAAPAAPIAVPELAVSAPSPVVAPAGANDGLRRKIQMLQQAQTSSRPLGAQQPPSAVSSQDVHCDSPADAEDDSMSELESQLSREDILVVDTATNWAPVDAVRVAQLVPPKTGANIKPDVFCPASKHAAAAERRKALEQQKKDDRAAREQKREQANARRRQQQVVEDHERGEILAAERARKEKMLRAKMDSKVLAAKNEKALAKRKEEEAALKKEEAAKKDAEQRKRLAEAATRTAAEEEALATQEAEKLESRIPSALVAQCNTSQPDPFRAPPADFKPVKSLSAKKMSLEETNYSISPQRDSDESESDSEDEPTKKIPKWAQKEELGKALERQQTQDPDAIFPMVNTCDLGRIFTTGRERKCFTKRGESGLWEKDGLQMSEIQRWRKQMGFSMTAPKSH